MQVKEAVIELKRLQKWSESIWIQNQTRAQRELLLELEFGNEAAEFGFEMEEQTGSAARNGSEAGPGGIIGRWAGSHCGPYQQQETEPS